ncbi:hypothetical protein LG329_01215 [Virgibacillus necropolis]|uniref:hypothetical protein n=1 Tax=Virgibacillus necropolis TaxID=163877 RepID=UPI00384F6D6A
MGKQRMERKKRKQNNQNEKLDNVEFASERKDFISEIDLVDKNEQRQLFDKRM